MLLTPRYDGDPLLTLEPVPDDPSGPVLRQRRRLGTILAGLDEQQWSSASRCEGWSVRDVIAHLVGTNQFWAISIAAGLAGEPTRFLATFDPVATPAQMVEGVRSVGSAEMLARYHESTDALADVLTGLTGDAWTALAEAPPGHVAVHTVLAHALWDAWVHERDVVQPLGIDPVEEPDELAMALHYAAALGPAFTVARGGGRRGTLAVEAVEPDVRFVVEIGDDVRVRDGVAEPGTPTLRGPAVHLLEGLSFRTDLHHDLDDDDRWLLAGVDEVFDLTT